MEAAIEGNDVLTPSLVAGQLDGRLYSLRASAWGGGWEGW
jgi:hypothetical protein